MASMICKLDNMEDYLTYFVRRFPNSVDITKSYWQKISYYRQLPSCLLFRPQQKFAVFVNFFNPWEGFKKCLQKTNSNTYSTCTITYKTEHVDSILLCICSVVIDHRWCKNVVRTRKWLTRSSQVCHWCMHTLACYRLHKLHKMTMLQTSEMGPFRVPFRAWTSSGFNWNLEMNASATVSFICILWLRD